MYRNFKINAVLNYLIEQIMQKIKKLGIAYLWALSMMFLSAIFSVSIILMIHPPHLNLLSSNVKKGNIDYSMLTACVSLEELIFRFIPFIIALFIPLGKYSRYRLYVIYCIGILSSIMFGLAHGNYLNIFIQGLGGMVLWICMLEAYTLYINKGVINAIIISIFYTIIIHLSFDILVMFSIWTCMFVIIIWWLSEKMSTNNAIS
jgi:hypothetical protein